MATEKMKGDKVVDTIAERVGEMAHEKFPEYDTGVFTTYKPDLGDKNFQKMFEETFDRPLFRKADYELTAEQIDGIAKNWLTSEVEKKAPCVIQEENRHLSRNTARMDVNDKIDDFKYISASEVIGGGQEKVDEFFNGITSQLYEFKESFISSYLDNSDAQKDISIRLERVIESIDGIKEDVEKILDPELDESDRESLEEEIPDKVQDAQQQLFKLDRPIEYNSRFDTDISDLNENR